MNSWPDSGYTPFRGAKATGWEMLFEFPVSPIEKGMIIPGQINDGLFDVMDIFNTSVH